jgi:hypothetical protein
MPADSNSQVAEVSALSAVKAASYRDGRHLPDMEGMAWLNLGADQQMRSRTLQQLLVLATLTTLIQYLKNLYSSLDFTMAILTSSAAEPSCTLLHPPAPS